MIMAEVFKSGDLQTIIFPKAFHLDADKVEIRRHANEIILNASSKLFFGKGIRIISFTLRRISTLSASK